MAQGTWESFSCCRSRVAPGTGLESWPKAEGMAASILLTSGRRGRELVMERERARSWEWFHVVPDSPTLL